MECTRVAQGPHKSAKGGVITLYSYMVLRYHNYLSQLIITLPTNSHYAHENTPDFSNLSYHMSEGLLPQLFWSCFVGTANRSCELKSTPHTNLRYVTSAVVERKINSNKSNS